MAVPYIFANAVDPLPLSELDVNFATPIVLGSSYVVLGGTFTEIDDLTLRTPVLITPNLGSPTAGNLTSCTGYTFANLAGTAPIWNQNTTGNAATATNLQGGLTNSVPIQTSAGTTAFLTPPTVSGTGIIYDGLNVTWGSVASASADGVVYENGQTIANNYTMSTGKNGQSVGAITILSTVQVSIPSGSRWVIL